MITHTVFFTLNQSKDAAEEQVFFDAARKLADIPGVQNFTCLKQISPKNNFEFGLSMEFDTQELYTAYTNHPAHTEFVQQHWIPGVADFMEIDYQPL
ncbi:Dabb family protein [Spirosoma pollinicola]|uniref:Stress responsive alpha-beta barrel domain-containing protein n=1 Tax=Spirosoma pollinicola TaxID=2057025 RepID=A0A2K8YYC3_9BACT|nr:Dabb family protein [Spirosoma pollinicola]AUD02633.1 stress responsive alpha-beta barrel domain-containing protein [Spirosoma pollinicola]